MRDVIVFLLNRGQAIDPTVGSIEAAMDAIDSVLKTTTEKRCAKCDVSWTAPVSTCPQCGDECAPSESRQIEPVDPDSEAANPVWDLVIAKCAQAWPPGLLVWNQSPLELITTLINERDDAKADAIRLHKDKMDLMDKYVFSGAAPIESATPKSAHSGWLPMWELPQVTERVEMLFRKEWTGRDDKVRASHEVLLVWLDGVLTDLGENIVQPEEMPTHWMAIPPNEGTERGDRV